MTSSKISEPHTPSLQNEAFGRTRLGEFWFAAKDGDEAVRSLMNRHYSRKRYADGRNQKLFVGPGEKHVLITEAGDAIFIWRKFISDDGQQGINCAAFRNEQRGILSSELILDAERIAWKRWPGERLYTYVNPKKIKSTNPGACFKKAGWKAIGASRRGLVILAKVAPAADV